MFEDEYKILEEVLNYEEFKLVPSYMMASDWFNDLLLTFDPYTNRLDQVALRIENRQRSFQEYQQTCIHQIKNRNYTSAERFLELAFQFHEKDQEYWRTRLDLAYLQNHLAQISELIPTPFEIFTSTDLFNLKLQYLIGIIPLDMCLECLAEFHLQLEPDRIFLYLDQIINKDLVDKPAPFDRSILW